MILQFLHVRTRSRAGSSAKLQPWCWPGKESHQCGRIQFQSHVVIRRIQSFAGCKNEELSFLVLWTTGSTDLKWPQFLTTCHRQLIIWHFASEKQQEQESSAKTVLVSYVTESRKWHPITLAIFTWLEESHIEVLPSVMRSGLQKGGIMGPPQDMPTTWDIFSLF